ncbi:hypothetical protein PENTCL1PPCAC_12704 [Pristionchus entomophagus]|uniref:Nuclear receptor domain-containing protein n=1 Tax=Pristionchus entomophagus TaxID=358040 RepID=A0AAV5T5F9_9BILA|nr:hypothetical protein PENTCL1PPCAC_12704 [Pristionchus entomophagus]
MTAALKKTIKCLICGAPVNHSHLGIDSCRACAVFYKRTVDQKHQLVCKSGTNDCRKKGTIISCRKCRFDRFKSIYDRACASERIEPIQDDDVLSDSEQCPDDPTKAVDEPSPTFIDHNNYFDCVPSSSSTPIIDRMKQAYSALCIARKASEMSSLNDTVLHDQKKNGRYGSHSI